MDNEEDGGFELDSETSSSDKQALDDTTTEVDGIDLLLKEFENSDVSENFEDEFDNQEDEYVDEILHSLQSKGFIGIDDFTFDALEVLHNRAEIFDSSGKTISEHADLVCTKTILNFSKFYSELNSSIAVNVKRDDNDFKSFNTYFVTSSSNILLKRIRGCIQANYGDMLDRISRDDGFVSQDKVEEIANTVYYALRIDPELDELISEDYDAFIQNVKTTLNSMLNLQNAALTQNKINETYRKNTSKYLLQDELKIIDYMKEDITDTEDGRKKFNVKFIKQIFTNSKEFKFRCELCDNLVAIDKPVAVNLSFPVNGSVGKRSMIFPNIFTCSCGQKHCFAEPEINSLEQFIKKDAIDGIDKFTKKLTDMSEGSALLKYQIPIDILDNVWSYLFVSQDIDTDTNIIPEQEDDIFSIQITSDTEFNAAVRDFYTILNTFDSNTIPKVFKRKSNDTNVIETNNTESEKSLFNTSGLFEQDSFFSQVDDFFDDEKEEIEERSDLLSYKEIAIYFCKVLSIDYNTVRNKAFFSLVFLINNNKVINPYLNQSNIYKLESVLKFIDNCESMLEKNRLPDENQLVELVCIATHYGNDSTLAKLEEVKDDKTKYCHILLEILKSEKNIIKDVLKENNLVRDKIITGLEESIDSLAFAQIINISQFNLRSILDVITDERIYRLFDLLADRMIVTNYAEDFYNKYVTFKILNVTTLNKSLVSGIKSAKITSRVQKAIMNYCNNNSIRISEWDLSKNFHMVDALTQSNLGILKELNKAFTDADYYRFCQIIVEIVESPMDLDTLISNEYNDLLKSFLKDSYSAAKDLLNSYDSSESYYLKNFSKEEQTLAMGYKKHIHFSRYMPIPLDNEGVIDYLDRYDNLMRNGEITKYNSIDFGKGFDNYTKYFGLLFSCSALYETAYHSYTVATFITQFIKVITLSNSSKEQTCKLLGISTPILNLIDFEIINNDEKINFENVKLLSKIFSGIYISSVKNQVDDLYTAVDEFVVKNNSNLTTIINQYDIEEWLYKIANLDETTFTPYEDVPEIIDYADAMNELYEYTSFSGLEQYL